MGDPWEALTAFFLVSASLPVFFFSIDFKSERRVSFR